MGFSKSRFIVMLIYIVLISSCVSAFGGKEESLVKPVDKYSTKTITPTGSYTVVSINGARVQDAFEILREYLKNDGIVPEEPFEAWQQVVSGYKIRISCLYIQNKVEGVLEGVVYFSPNGTAKVLSWRKEN